MTIHLALYQPDIAQNTGTLLRLGACLGVHVHIIHPTGFALSAQTLKRAALDYLDRAQYTEHDDHAQFERWRQDAGHRLVLLTTKATTSAYAVSYAPGDILMLGRETAGVPDEVAETADLKVRIPMQDGLRSINVALAGTLVLGEAMRQTDAFKGLK